MITALQESFSPFILIQPWKRVIGMRNIISHEYLSIDPEVIFATVKKRLPPLLADIRQILQDIKNGLRDAEIQSLAAK